MDAVYHQDEILRESTIARYLSRRLSAAETEQFESHYLACQDCFEEVRAAEALIYALGQPAMERTQANGITVLRFTPSTQLTGTSELLDALSQSVQVQGDTRVLIDLSGVSRIDSAGLGTLMRCYTHALRNSGMLKLLNPSKQVKHVLSMTRIDSIVPTFEDEGAALKSFH
jgi:anti-anti-sigma factor